MQQIMHSFRGHTPPPEVIAAVKRGEIAAFCLFAYNVVSPAQLRELTGVLHRAAEEGGHPPPLIGIDQEGGQLIPVTGGATELPGNMALGATRSPELARKAGYVLGRELLAMGINLNFAPALDVNINPANPVVGTRSFGDSPALVSELGTALIQGIQAEGVIATAKHFPGHGDTSADSHHATPVVSHSRTRLTQVELVPFQAAIKAGVGGIITAHVLYTALDNQTPATLSSFIINDLLRHEMGFGGLVITDAMDMTSVSTMGALESVQAALQAGIDLALLGHLPNQLDIARQTTHLTRPEALARIQAARQNAPRQLPPFELIGCAEHQAIAQEIADHSITIVRDNGTLPLHPTLDDEITVITVKPLDLTPADTSSTVRIELADAIQKRHPNIQRLEIPYAAADSEIQAILQAAAKSRLVIVGTINASEDKQQAALVQALYNQGHNVIVVALRTPYDLAAFPMIETYLCAYSIRHVTTEAIARVLFGEIEARGTLPCSLSGLITAQPEGELP